MLVSVQIIHVRFLSHDPEESGILPHELCGIGTEAILIRFVYMLEHQLLLVKTFQRFDKLARSSHTIETKNIIGWIASKKLPIKTSNSTEFILEPELFFLFSCWPDIVPPRYHVKVFVA